MADKLALVLAGGGARAAYQVGVLARIAEEFPDIEFPILTGVSAGAINAAYLANSLDSFSDTTRRLVDLWSRLEMERVILARPAQMAGIVASWGFRLLAGGAATSTLARGMVDTAPLAELLSTELDQDDGNLRHLPHNVESGKVSALAITTTNYATGQAMTFMEGASPEEWQKPYRIGRRARLSVNHILASASIPLLFPAVKLGPSWHGDGGVRQTAPLSPAVHLGARKILAVSTLRTPAAHRPEPADSHYPPPAQILGVLVNSIFLDNIDYDAANLERINALQRTDPKVARREGLRHVDLLVMRPSRDLGQLAGEFEGQLPWAFRYMMRGWGTKETTASDLLAAVLFEADYAKRLIQIGREDTEARLPELRVFLESSRERRDSANP